MAKLLLCSISFVVALIGCQSVQAQDKVDETIVVTAERDAEEDVVREAVRDIAMRGRNQYEPLSQYQAPLCTEVRGLGGAANMEVAARVAANTLDAGFAIGEEGCDVNALIVIVDDPATLIDHLRETQPKLFTVQVNRRLKSALKRNDPAIAWAAKRNSGPSGKPLVEAGAVAGIAGAPGLFENPGATVMKTRSGGVSRFMIPYSVEKVFTVVVFDVNQLIGAHLNQIADFSTMRILADPQPRISLESGQVDSILTLFDAGVQDAPQSLTDLDRAYLKGLYSLRPNAASSRLEREVIAAYESGSEDD